MKALNARTKDETIAYVRQFLSQRAARRQSAQANPLPPETINFEKQREWLEGLAKYAELTIGLKAAATPGYQALPVMSADPDFNGYAPSQLFYKLQLMQTNQLQLSQGEVVFYYTGMAQAVLLDRLLPDWKPLAEQDGVWLEDLLADAVK